MYTRDWHQSEGNPSACQEHRHFLCQEPRLTLRNTSSRGWRSSPINRFQYQISAFIQYSLITTNKNGLRLSVRLFAVSV